MGFLKRLFGIARPQADDALVLYIRCQHCQTVLRVRIDLAHDLQNTYEDSGPSYVLKKEAMDSTCFRMMSISMEFDGNKKVLTQEVTGGEFVGPEEYREGS